MTDTSGLVADTTLAPTPAQPAPQAAPEAAPALTASAALGVAVSTAEDLLTPAGETNVKAALTGNLAPLASELVTDTKPFWTSKTLVALGVSALGAVASHFGHPIAAADQANLVADIANSIPPVLQYGGLAMAAIFRVIGVAKLV